MDNNESNNHVFYNIRNDENGNVRIEKTVFDGSDNHVENNENSINMTENPVSDRPQERKVYEYKEKSKSSSSGKLAIVFILVVLLSATSIFLFNLITGASKKNRTFLIYMVGSDLESTGGYATFDLYDIENASIDLDNNNVILMVGGSKKWHNFVDSKKIGLYKLGKNGFEKIKEYPLSTMGSSEQLSNFLNYAYNKYPAKDYDLIFWNHGLGSLGLEDDEVSEDFIDIEELDVALKNSPFNNNKLELVIFNNCLAGNIHFATVMSNYAEYMVGSEEIMYVGSIIDRLNFLGEVNNSDNAFEVGKHYVDRSDNSMESINSGWQQYDTTLSILDLSMVDEVNNNLNKFISSIDLNNYYYNVSRARMNLHTYSSEADYVYDTVDLYELVEALEPFATDKTSASNLKKSISNIVKYNSSNDSHSNGLSIYFPYYGNANYVETHLYYFDRLWNNEYLDFITNYYDLNSSTRRAYRASTGSEINKLSNSVVIDGNTVKLELNDSEKETYQRANVYVFEKNGDDYNLVVKSNKVEINDNILTYNFEGVLKSSNGKYISLYDLDKKYIYSMISENDAITYLSLEDGVNIVGSNYDSGSKPTMGIVEKLLDPDEYYQVNYKLMDNGNLKVDWNENLEKVEIGFDEENDTLSYVSDNLSNYYVMIELYDLNNDTFYAY